MKKTADGLSKQKNYKNRFNISLKTLLLLVLPIVISVLMKSYTPKAFESVKKMQPISFYLWAVCMMVLIGSTIHTIMMQENSNFVMEAIMIAGALIICIVQFALGTVIVQATFGYF